MAEDVKIISRPKVAPPSDIKIISRPAAPEPAPAAEPPDEGFTGNVIPLRRDAQGLHPAVPRLLRETYDTAMGAGDAALSGDVERMKQAAPGAAMLGVGGSAGAAAKEAAPATRSAVDAVVSKVKEMAPGVAANAKDTANLAVQGARAAGPAVNTAASKVGGVARNAVDAVEDVVKQRMAGRERTAAEKIANAAPTKESLYGDAEKAFSDPKITGTNVAPDAFRETVSGLKEALKADDVDLVNHPDNYEQTAKMLKAIERVAGSAEEGEGSAASDGVTSFKDLIKLERSLRPYLRKAKAAGAREGDDTDFRAATILKRQIENFRGGQGDEANAALTQGKELYKRASKLDDIDEIVSEATRLNNPDTIPNEFAKIAKDKYTYNNYTPAEQALIDKIARNSTLDNVGTGFLGTKFGKAAKVASLVDTRKKLVEELRDMVARGGDAQKAAAAEKAAQPSFMDRFNQTLNPGPQNSANRASPYTASPRAPIDLAAPFRKKKP